MIAIVPPVTFRPKIVTISATGGAARIALGLGGPAPTGAADADHLGRRVGPENRRRSTPPVLDPHAPAMLAGRASMHGGYFDTCPQAINTPMSATSTEVVD